MVHGADGCISLRTLAMHGAKNTQFKVERERKKRTCLATNLVRSFFKHGSFPTHVAFMGQSFSFMIPDR